MNLDEVSALTDWTDIENININRGRYKFPGIYIIRLSDAAGNPIPITRFLCTDSSGIMSIGVSVNVRRRLREFFRSMNGKSEHSEGTAMYSILVFTNFKVKYKEYRVQFIAEQFKNKKRAEEEEEIILKEYFNKYGDLPPLNHSQPGKHGIWVVTN